MIKFIYNYFAPVQPVLRWSLVLHIVNAFNITFSPPSHFHCRQDVCFEIYVRIRDKSCRCAGHIFNHTDGAFGLYFLRFGKTTPAYNGNSPGIYPVADGYKLIGKP